MKRRTLDMVFSIGGLVFAVLLLVIGVVLQNQSNFAENYVKDQFAQQKIAFTPEQYLNGEQNEDGGQCLITNAGKPLETGKQAECYANQYIAVHLRGEAKAAGYEGETYASLHTPQSKLQDELKAAQDANQPTDEIQAKLTAVNELRDSMFTGETLRGLLLTTYGFSIFGERAGQAALVCFIAAAVLALLSIAGLVHAFTSKTKDDEVVAVIHQKEPATA